MLEDMFSEDDIWEYKSKRKPKPVRLNYGSESSPESVGKTADGKHKSRRSRNKKQPGKNGAMKEKAKDHEECLGETPSQASVASGPRSSCAENSQASQEGKTTPAKRCRTHKDKQVSPKMRPVYEGYCPNCQVPFSSLLGQTPRWHIFECLDSPQVSEAECPEGLLCTSTIPAHYKRYTHFLLAQNRANINSVSSPSPTVNGRVNCPRGMNSGFLSSLKTRWSPEETLLENLENVSDATSFQTLSQGKSQAALQTNQKISISTNSQKAQQAPTFSEGVPHDQPPGVGLLLADEELDSQHPRLPWSENDRSSCEISYSPLPSDEETAGGDELEDSQQELFSTQSSKEGSLEECTQSLCNEPRDPPVTGFLLQQDHEDLYKYHTLTHLSQLLSRSTEAAIACEDPACKGDCSMTFSPASGAPPTKAKAVEPAFHFPGAKDRKQAGEKSAVHSRLSPLLLESQLLNPFKILGDLPSENTNARTHPDRLCDCCDCRKAFGGTLKSGVSDLSSEPTPPAPPASQPAKIVMSDSKCTARHSANKAMKQMDIGVFFGLPPKKKQEDLPEDSALKGTSSNPAVSPKGKRAWPSKRKAERSLSDVEPDAKSLIESQLPVELSGQGSQSRQQKRRKKSTSLPGVASQKSEHISKTEAGPASLSRSRGFKRAAGGRQQRRTPAIPESPSAEGLPTRQCPFYKQIPGTGITVDAFQYGLIEGCTAYFLTHFHSDHYSGLSKNFTASIYCSKITGNLLKSKLHVQEQYIHPLPMDTECVVNGVKVVLLDANHCPGAVMILFHLPNGTVTLHTGDFRADPTMERSLLAGLRVHTLYLDTTYCSPEYSFPSQQEVIQFAINTAFEAVTLNPRVLVVCGTYSIGKEKVFLAIADVLGSKVAMSQEKYATLRCLNIPEMNSLITTDMCSALVHLLPMMQITFKVSVGVDGCNKKGHQHGEDLEKLEPSSTAGRVIKESGLGKHWQFLEK